MPPARSSARRRNARGEGARLRQEIIEAATRLIDSPTDRFSLRAIALEVGVATPSLYDHFSGIQSIRAAIIRSCYDDLIQRITTARNDIEDPVERLEATCFAYAGYGAEFPNRYALLFRTQRDQEELTAVRDRGAAALQTLVDSIADCQAAHRSTSVDPYNDAVAVWSAIHGLTTLRASRPHFDQLHTDAFMRHIVHRIACITPQPHA